MDDLDYHLHLYQGGRGRGDMGTVCMGNIAPLFTMNLKTDLGTLTSIVYLTHSTSYSTLKDLTGFIVQLQ